MVGEFYKQVIQSRSCCDRGVFSVLIQSGAEELAKVFLFFFLNRMSCCCCFFKKLR